LIWDKVSAVINIDTPRKVIFHFGPLDALITYAFFGTDFEWYGIKKKALRRLRL